MMRLFHCAMASALAAFWIHSLPQACAASAATLTIQADRPGASVSPLLWGIFFEDINLSADGGIYAERVRNRSFEDSDKPEHWSLITRGAGQGHLAISLEKPLATDPVRPRNRRSLRLDVTQADANSPVGIANDGYWGIALKQGERYDLSFHARSGARFQGPIGIALEGRDGSVYSRGVVRSIGPAWQHFKITLTSRQTDPQARLVLSATHAGTLWFDMVSLFPRTTWKGHGLRPDLAEMLAGLKPSFVRFPGGCWVEGDTMREAYRWKETIGDISERRTQWNIWQYWATHGLGYLEYLQMCEDLGAEPLFVINCGMSHRENIPMDQMGPFVQDALDAIEYANGPVTSPWGALRAKHGHPKPFHLRYLEIGNENGGPAYEERYALFSQVLKEKHPEIHLIANDWGGPPKKSPVEIVDEHYYNTPEFFMNQANKYDTYDRKGPKVYVGEYAVTQNGGQGNLRAAVGEAAFMIGLERNADVVAMASYAPLFVHVNHRRWNPDLINFDSARVYGIPGYYVQKMFSEHRGDLILPCDVDAPVAEDAPVGGAVGVGTWLTEAEFKDIRVTRGNETLFAGDFADGTQGWSLRGGEWKAQNGVLRQSKLDENVRAISGDKSWLDYTYTLKARKLSGAEGFLILFRVQNEDQKAWWNLGGWGNTRHGLEIDGVSGNDVSGKIETGRWYDIRVELRGRNIKCYLDGQLIHDVNYAAMKSLYASATRENKSGETILKVVNAAAQPQETEIKLNGVKNLGKQATAIVLTSEKPTDENSLSQPTKVAPVSSSLTVNAPEFRHVFPGNSVTILRLKTQ